MPAGSNRCAKDHPRSRGVYWCAGPLARPAGGSSPLARGLRGNSRLHRRPERIIPARAGFTRRASAGTAPWQDHPRSRGVYRSAALNWSKETGSSPLARGLRPPPQDLRVGGRIIPARAGFTNPCTDRRERAADHPRSRGVYADATMRGAMTVGSSPLARGLLDLGVQGGQAARIIPARAGFTHRGGLDRVACQDHPRSRGVYGDWIATAADAAGSSPLARGLLRVDLPEPGLHRIIPARAGFTPPRLGGRRSHPDHPRSRGVYVWPCRGPPAIRGSSPLARGLRGLVRGGGVDDGIIPARAGFTHHGPGLGRPPPDHPRSRGVYRPR